MLPRAIYNKTNARSISANLLGPRKLERYVRIHGKSPSPEATILIDCAVRVWNLIATDYQHTFESFPNIYALMFFLDVLAVGRKMLYRGQYNGEHSLETTLGRRLKQGWDPGSIEKAKNCYIEEVHKLGDRKHIKSIDPQPEALCQHYGFPTHFLDFTWSMNVARFFATGGDKRYSQPSDPQHPIGSIWAIDIAGDANSSVKTIQLP